MPLRGSAEVFVSPTGSDANPGTRAAPFATWERALAASRKQSGPATVTFREGAYTLNETVVLGPQDSGTTFRSAPGERAAFRSGVAISGWRK
eukprot:198154-Prymnesium_polylepis.1